MVTVMKRQSIWLATLVALLMPRAGVGAEKPSPELAKVRDWIRASTFSPVFSARNSRRALHVLRPLADGTIPVIAFAWLPGRGGSDSCESPSTAPGMRTFEVLTVLLDKDAHGQWVDKGHRLMTPLDVGTPEPAATALVVYPRVGDFNGDGVPELYLRIRRTWAECGCGDYVLEGLRIIRLDPSFAVEFAGREQTHSGCTSACYEGADYSLERRDGNYRLIETAVRCVPPKPRGKADPVAREKKTVLGWVAAEKAWKPIKQYPERVRDERAE
jgi:hypothetical protein